MVRRWQPLCPFSRVLTRSATHSTHSSPTLSQGGFRQPEREWVSQTQLLGKCSTYCSTVFLSRWSTAALHQETLLRSLNALHEDGCMFRMLGMKTVACFADRRAAEMHRVVLALLQQVASSSLESSDCSKGLVIILSSRLFSLAFSAPASYRFYLLGCKYLFPLPSWYLRKDV